ncbi:MAG: hypothetical protein J6B95_02695 [Oscillospiraceae bacterium]|nr:hypothetical protein [Oscillospiraceae bacterium]
MKKLILLCLLLGLFMTGCGLSRPEAERLFLADTVVNIPLNPEETAAPMEETRPEETATEETEAPTETLPEETKAPASSQKPSGSKTNSSSKPAAPKATEPPATQPPETEPPVTEVTQPPVFDISDYIPGSLESAVAEQINACRADAGLEPLHFSGTLCGIASVRAYEICQSWSHTRPDGSGWQTVLSDYGFGYSSAAEELAHTTGYDAASIVNKWMGAESNSADLLNPAYTTIGVGIYSANGSVFLAAILAG